MDDKKIMDFYMSTLETVNSLYSKIEQLEKEVIYLKGIVEEEQMKNVQTRYDMASQDKIRG